VKFPRSTQPYIRLQQEFIYLAVLMNVFTRSIRGWHLSRTIDQQLTLTALRKALENGCPRIHHSDQGVQYAAHDYVALLDHHQVQISMAEVGQAWQNGYAERLMRTIKEEEVSKLYRSLSAPGAVFGAGLHEKADSFLFGLFNSPRV
jgi:transposase InsO family protein